MRGHVPSCDEDGGHTMLSAVVENPMVLANLMALCFIEPELWVIKVIHCGKLGIGIFDVFSSCDLDLDPVTFIYKLDPYCLELYQMCKYELPTLRLSKVIV